MRFVFFDLDGTLIESTTAFRKLFVEVLGRNGVEIPLAKLEQVVFSCWPWYERAVVTHRGDELAFWLGFNTEVCRAAGAGERAEELGRAVTETFRGSDRPRLYPDVIPCLDVLQARGHTLGIITARPDAHRLLVPLGIRDRFRVVVDAFSSGLAKQDAASYHHALDRAGLAPDRAVHVGDEIERDIRPAREAGMQAVLLDRENRHPDTPFPRVQDLEAFTDWLATA